MRLMAISLMSVQVRMDGRSGRPVRVGKASFGPGPACGGGGPGRALEQAQDQIVSGVR